MRIVTHQSDLVSTEIGRKYVLESGSGSIISCPVKCWVQASHVITPVAADQLRMLISIQLRERWNSVTKFNLAFIIWVELCTK